MSIDMDNLEYDILKDLKKKYKYCIFTEDDLELLSEFVNACKEDKKIEQVRNKISGRFSTNNSEECENILIKWEIYLKGIFLPFHI